MKNFGNIKDTFNSILVESIIKKDNKGKKLFNVYLKTLKENEDLRKQYLIYKNLSTKCFDNAGEAKEYIKENISLLRGLNEKQLKKGEKKLNSLLEGKTLSSINTTLYDTINILVNTEKTPSTLDTIIESINNIKDMMLERKEVIKEDKDMINLPPSVLTQMATTKFNTKYANINEDEKEILKAVLNGNEEDRKTVYHNLKTECIDTIDNKLNENIDLDLKDKILKVKDKLLRMTYNPDEYVKDIDKVYELKKSVAAEE
jgi:hypothetical protein